ncbi:unnamed protein product [Urochloa humidicola]
MEASPVSSSASFVFPTSTSISVSSYVSSEEFDANTYRNIDQIVNCVRGGDHTAAAWQWHRVQHEIDAMAQQIHIKAKTQHTLAWSYAARLLSFADETTKLQLSPEKLFVVLRLHKVLSVDFFIILQRHPEDFSTTKYNHTLKKLRQAVFHMLRELKILIQKRASRSVPKAGGIHEVTRYVMNYIKLLLQHRSSVSFILAHNDSDDKSMDSLDHIVQDLIVCLEAMLNRVAEAYDSVGLQCFFLMNNLHFVIKCVEDLELSQLLGHSWVQLHRDFIDQYMETYLDLSWGPVVSCLRTRKTVLGCCFHQSSNTVRFCLKFDSTYYNQEHWMVEDPKFRDVVRRAVCNKVTSAYRAHIEKSRKVQTHKWYTSELLEVHLMQLFEGTTG